MILLLFVGRKAKKYCSFPLDFTPICLKKSKENEMPIFPTWFPLSMRRKAKKYTIFQFPTWFYLYLWEEKQKIYYFPVSYLILPLFVRRKAKKYPSFLLDFTSICESEMVVSAVGLTNLVSPAQSGTSHTPCFISTRYPLFVSCSTPCLLRFYHRAQQAIKVKNLRMTLEENFVLKVMWNE